VMGVGVAEVLWVEAAWWEVEEELVWRRRSEGCSKDCVWGDREHRD
jgi:hypothetical protein